MLYLKCVFVVIDNDTALYCYRYIISEMTDVFAVDAYAAVAKEKHGYNMEQVLCAFHCNSKKWFTLECFVA